MTLSHWTLKRESKDAEAELALSASSCFPASPPRPEEGLKFYWKEKNQKSLDGLPGLLSAFNSTTTFPIARADKEMIEESVVDESEATGATSAAVNELNSNSFSMQHPKLPFYGSTMALTWREAKPVVGFVLGWLSCLIWIHHEKVFPWLQTSALITYSKVWKF